MRLRKLERIIKLFLPPIITEPVRRRRARNDRPYDNIPDRAFYDGVFSPWQGYGEFGPLFGRMRPNTRVSRERAWGLHSLARQAVDEFFADRPEVPLVLPTGQAAVFRAG